MTLDYFVFTAEQRAAAMAFNNAEAGLIIDPKLVDAAEPGSAPNFNGMAEGIAVDEGVPLAGKFVSGYEMFNDLEYLRVVPGMVAYALTLPVCKLDPAVIFAPPEEV